MTGPGDPTPASRPGRLRPNRSAAPHAQTGFEAAEIAQGQAAAVLGALARMQLRLDVLAREQSDMFARLQSGLDDIASRLSALEQRRQSESTVPSPPSTLEAPSSGENDEVPLPSWTTHPTN